MPQVEGGPKHLNHILESAYSAAMSQGHDKGTASAIAWAAAKNKYKKNGGKWIVKFEQDLTDLVMLLQQQLVKAPSAVSSVSNMDYLKAALDQLSELMKHDLTKIDEGNPLVWLGVDDVMLNPEHNPVDKKFQQLCMDNIKETGEVKPLTYSLVDNDGVDVPMITDGFHRYHALKELGYKFIPARLSDERGTKTTDRDEPVKLEDTAKMEKKDKNPAVEYMPIDSFFLNPYHTPADRKIVDEKKDKIEENDEVKPLLYSEIDNNGKIEYIIVDGFHRFIALKELGYTEIPVLKVGSQGIKISETLKKVPLKKVKKEIASTDVNGLGLVRQDLQSEPKKKKKLDVTIKFEKTWSDEAREASIESREDGSGMKLHSTEAHGSYFTRQHPSGAIETFYRPTGSDQDTKIGSMHNSMEEAENSILQHKQSFLGEILPPQRREMEGSPYRGGGPGTSSGPFGSTREQLKPTGMGQHGGHEGGEGGHGSSFGGRHGRQEASSAVPVSQDKKKKPVQVSGTPLSDGKLPAPVGQYQVRDVDTGKQVTKGGPGSGRHPENKAFDEPFHSGSHVQQFLGSNDVVIGSVDKSHLSPEKNALRQKEFESTLDKWNLPYKKGAGHSSEWGNETSYIVHAPRKEDAESLHHLLTRQYKQDAVIHVRNGHAVMNFNGGTNEPIKHANINGGLEAGDSLNDNYTTVDGQKFRINFK